MTAGRVGARLIDITPEIRNETELQFRTRLCVERAKELHDLRLQLAHVYALLFVALGTHVRQGLAADINEALEMVQEEADRS